MKNIHILPTDKPSILRKFIVESKILIASTPSTKGQGLNIYITSDEIIKECYVFNSFNDSVYKIIPDNSSRELLGNPINLPLCSINKEHYQKIILTTDPDLIEDGVQAIDNEFLEWYVKNPNCEYVEIEKEKLFIKGEADYFNYDDGRKVNINAGKYKIIV